MAYWVVHAYVDTYVQTVHIAHTVRSVHTLPYDLYILYILTHYLCFVEFVLSEVAPRGWIRTDSFQHNQLRVSQLLFIVFSCISEMWSKWCLSYAICNPTRPIVIMKRGLGNKPVSLAFARVSFCLCHFCHTNHMICRSEFICYVHWLSCAVYSLYIYIYPYI